MAHRSADLILIPTLAHRVDHLEWVQWALSMAWVLVWALRVEVLGHKEWVHQVWVHKEWDLLEWVLPE